MSRRNGWMYAGTAAIAAALSWYALGFPLNHDVGWWLYIAQSMLQGESLYSDLIEINPPLYGYLMMIPAGLATASGLSAIVLVKGAVLFTCLAMIAWSMWLAGQHGRGYLPPLLGVVLAAPLLGLVGIDYGQREHAMFALVAPYLILIATRLTGASPSTRCALAVGFIGGVGFALKPHFFLLWIAVEGFVLTSQKPVSVHAWLRRPEIWAVAGVLFTYGTFVLVVYPEYFALLWNARHLYQAFAAHSRLDLIWQPYVPVIIVGLIGAVPMRMEKSQIMKVVRSLLVFSTAAWFVVILQGKGWSYHYFPAFASGVTADLLLLVAIGRRIYSSRGLPPIGHVVSMVLLASILWITCGRSVEFHRLEAQARNERIAAQLEWIKQNSIDSLLILSPWLERAFPVVNYADVRWGSPFPILWWLPEPGEASPGGATTAKMRAPPTSDSVERAFRDALVSRFRQTMPEAVLVDTAPSYRFSGRAFPYVAYLSQDEEFRETWSHYERQGTLGRHVIYRRAADEAVTVE